MNQKLQGTFLLALWVIAVFFLFRHTSLALDEGAAKALLLDWSIGDQVASSVVTLGLPDLRVLTWIPLGFLWPGQVIAAKVMTLVLFAHAIYLLYLWHIANKQEETALLACGLALIAPLTIQQIDQLNPGVMLFITMVYGAYLDRAYRSAPRLFGGNFFAQLLLILFATSLHPMGVAYGLAVFYGWYKESSLGKLHQRSFLVGSFITLLMGILLRWGWREISFGLNPFPAAAGVFLGHPLDVVLNLKMALLGLIAILLAVLFLISERKVIVTNQLSLSLSLALVIGVVSSDYNWGFMVLMFILNVGFPWILKPREALLQHGFFVQRGWLWILLLVIGTTFLHTDRNQYYLSKGNVLSNQDQLIQTLSDDVDLIRKVSDENSVRAPKIRVASQWPARTMIACRCDVLPLPPVTAKPEQELALIKGITHIVFVPNENKNLGLTQNLSMLGDRIETVSLQPGGVILHVKQSDQK
ncbi:MAG: hypothetical protein KGN31_02660 [Betaproteobacteria bacterium]|nr:hypothetical protein [Betaproteobacteria bacterium]